MITVSIHACRSFFRDFSSVFFFFLIMGQFLCFLPSGWKVSFAYSFVIFFFFFVLSLFDFRGPRSRPKVFGAAFSVLLVISSM